MTNEDRFEFEAGESSFFKQLPSVLIAAAAICMILLVNTGRSTAPDTAALPAETGSQTVPSADSSPAGVKRQAAAVVSGPALVAKASRRVAL